MNTETIEKEKELTPPETEKVVGGASTDDKPPHPYFPERNNKK